MEREGYIYVITNKLNGTQYVGQTTRNLEVRFNEHCTEKRGHSPLHKAIQKYGWVNFKIEELERCPISQLNTREEYWVNKLDTYNNGYNLTPGGNNIAFGRQYNNILIVEANLIVESKEYLSKRISEVTSWGMRTISAYLKNAIEKEKLFLDYHYKQCQVDSSLFADESDLDNWIKTLNAKYVGKHVYCPELNMEFDTLTSAAKYCIDNGYYTGQAKFAIQSLLTSIGNYIKGKATEIPCLKENLTFDLLPGTTKNPGAVEEERFKSKKVYCKQLDKTFESQIEAANYFTDRGLFGSVKLKTAKLRISDVVRGYFPEYKGYTFEYIE